MIFLGITKENMENYFRGNPKSDNIIKFFESRIDWKNMDYHIFHLKTPPNKNVTLIKDFESFNIKEIYLFSDVVNFIGDYPNNITNFDGFLLL